MFSSEVRRRRSALYVPASNARAVEKARSLPCDVVILDLEDAVAPEGKAEARARAVSVAAEGGFAHRELVVRVNGLDTPWGAEDLAALGSLPAAAGQLDALLLPKIDRAEQLAAAAARVIAHLGRKPALWAMIETPRAVMRLDDIAAEGVKHGLTCLVAGTNDLVKETGFQPGADRSPLQAPLAWIVLAARAHGLGALDGVYNAIDDVAGLTRQCAQGREFGFDGKTLIHPGQIVPCNEAFTPDAAAVAAARAIVDAFAAPENATRGAIRLAGQMVERLHLTQARRILVMAEQD